MKVNLKSEKGIAMSDVIVAVLLIAIFTGVIATIGYNIAVTSSSLKRMSAVTNYITTVFEHIDQMYYDDVTTANVEMYCMSISDLKNQNVNNTDWDGKGYNVEIKVEQYKPEETSMDLVKVIELKVSYKLNGKLQEINMSRIKKRENLDIPNKPELELVSKENGENVYPIKYYNGIWKVTSEADGSWYNYNEGTFAVVIVTEDKLETNQKISINDFENIYIWIPRYAYGEEIKFLFKETDNYVETNGEGYNVLEKIDKNEYTIVGQSNKNGKWITIDNLEDEELVNFIEMKNIY